MGEIFTNQVGLECYDLERPWQDHIYQRDVTKYLYCAWCGMRLRTGMINWKSTDKKNQNIEGV